MNFKVFEDPGQKANKPNKKSSKSITNSADETELKFVEKKIVLMGTWKPVVQGLAVEEPKQYS